MRNNNYKNSNNNTQNQINKITAPYNFVPLNKEIFYPDWAENISHDIPFRDGQSGEIKIIITAKSPIFISNHYEKCDECHETKKENKDDKTKEAVKISKEFCHHKNADGGKEFYIPSTSVKGMVRNLVEIMSFSAIKIDEKYKKTFSVRDMTNQKVLVGTATGMLNFDNTPKDKNSGFGLLKINEQGCAFIDDYGAPRNIDARELKSFSNYKKEQDVLEKYKAIYPYSTIKVLPYYADVYDRNKKKIGRKKMAKFQSNGEAGIIFCSNFIERKHHEFILLKSDIVEKNIKIPSTTLDDFKKVYFEEGNTDTHKLGKFWKEQLKTANGKNFGIPVFYVKTNGNITAIGLTQLFKLNYKKSLYEASRQNTEPKKLDLAECIFGTIKDNVALKGRVYFSHFVSNIIRYEPEVESVLGSPNPGYYPNYIEQNDNDTGKVKIYTTLMDSHAKIRGWKKYPIQIKPHNTKSGEINHATSTRFQPLQKGVIFSGKLRFHNLRPAELGAVLSALTFHGKKDHLHNIGMAKPLGYGKIEISLDFSNANLEHSQEIYLKEFENLMNSWDKKEFDSWQNSKQLKELFAIHDINKSKNLEYQKLDPNNKINDFAKAKKAKLYLKPYSKY